MLPIGPLMIEHRLIERMIKLLKEKSEIFYNNQKPDIIFIDNAVDFIRTYADKCHHGKEEDILFRDLAKKHLDPEHKKTMDELIKDHIYGRNITKSLVDAKEKYTKGASEALTDIVKAMKILADFYPKHIEKEDKHFFIPCMDYFTKEKKESMLKEFFEFDKKLIHQKYSSVIEKYEQR